MIMLAMGDAGAQTAPAFYPADTFDQKKIEIYVSRIFKVPEATQPEAFGLLAKTNFVHLTPQQLRMLFHRADFDTKRCWLARPQQRMPMLRSARRRRPTRLSQVAKSGCLAKHRRIARMPDTHGEWQLR
jgi:hypothetical protein